MAEYQFSNSENSYSQEVERHTGEPIVLHFEGVERAVHAAAQNKIFKLSGYVRKLAVSKPNLGQNNFFALPANLAFYAVKHRLRYTIHYCL